MESVSKSRHHIPPISPVKGTFPFRIGSTSYIFPDDILPNVQALAGVVDDIELVLFESEDISNFPDEPTIRSLAQLAGTHNLSYTVHLPIDRKAGSSDPLKRSFFISQCRRVIDLTRPLDPAGYILHLEGIDPGSGEPEVDGWRERVRTTCSRILESGVDPALICVENLAYPIQWHQSIIEEFGFAYCLDIGHLWRYGADWKPICAQHLPSTRVIHLHGESGGKDHIALTACRERLEQLIPLLRDYRGILTVELFSADEFFPSLELIDSLWHTAP